MGKNLSLAGYLAVKEVWRNRGRFLLVSLVIALITLLVLFIAALGEGLGNGNREYISKLDGELLVYQAKSENLINASRLGRDRLASIRRVEGVADAGMLGTSSANLVLPEEPLKVAILGVEPGHVGEPQVVEGQQLSTDLADEVIIDSNTAYRTKLTVGQNITIRTTQGTRDEFFTLQIVGITDGQQYSLQPAVFLPFNTWDKVRPKSEAEVNLSNPIANVVIVKLADPEQVEVWGKELSKNRPVVVYCGGEMCGDSRRLAARQATSSRPGAVACNTSSSADPPVRNAGSWASSSMRT